ncbi:MAG TPA: type IV pilin protein [Gallionella sp.]|nr:type IV pilin protein [Gallionella sp.]
MNTTCNETPASGRLQRGFTLVELMVTVAIIGILAAIAYPSYVQYTVKSNRAAAESFIMSVANKQEQYMLNARQYATTLAALGVAVPADVSRNYTITEPISVTAIPPGYTITAVPAGNQAANDTKCGSISIDQAGTKGVSGTGTVAVCW